MCLIYFRVLFETRKNDDDLVLRAECPILNKLDFEVNIKRVVSNTLPDGIPRTDVTATLQPVKVSTGENYRHFIFKIHVRRAAGRGYS